MAKFAFLFDSTELFVKILLLNSWREYNAELAVNIFYSLTASMFVTAPCEYVSSQLLFYTLNLNSFVIMLLLNC